MTSLMSQLSEKGRVVMNKIYYEAKDIMALLGVSRATAYNIIQELNKELNGRGYMTVRGKVSKTFFNERFYGLTS